MKRYVVSDRESLRYFDTEEEAKRIAAEAIPAELDEATDPPEWPTDMEDIWWAEIKGVATRGPLNDDGLCDYELEPPQ